MNTQVTAVSGRIKPPAESIDELAALVRERRGQFLNVADRLAPQCSEADDLLQEALLRALLGLARGAQTVNLEGWLSGIVRHLARDQQRRRARERKLIDRLAESGRQGSVDGAPCWQQTSTERDELRARLDPVIDQLSPANREAIRAFYLNHCSLAETAAALGITPNAAKVRLHKAREALRPALTGVAAEWGLIPPNATSKETRVPKLPAEIAGFHALSVLGRGARSTIYAAEDPTDGRLYALKRLVHSSENDDRFFQESINEHEIASRRIDHLNVRKSYKLIRMREDHEVIEVLLMMEIVEGVTLAESRTLDLAEQVRVFRGVATGLQAMHEAGFVHADIKPNNIMLAHTGQVKLIDLGQACPIGTVKQRIQGTPGYLAPEQFSRRAITPRTDVFGFGATMYRCITGHSPDAPYMKGAGSVSTSKRKRMLRPGVKLPPPNDGLGIELPSRFNPKVPPVLERLILACLKKQPSRRPQSMREVLDRLDRLPFKPRG